MIAPESHLPLALTASAALAVNLLAGPLWAAPAWGAVLIVAYLFREQRRAVPALPLAVVSPVDGKALSLRRASDPWLEREVLRAGIRLPLPGLRPLRSPTEGKVMDYRHSTDFGAAKGPCTTPLGTAVCHALWVRTDEDDDVVMVVSSRFTFHRLRFYVRVGERVGQGQRCGFMFFGTRVDVLMPPGSRAEAQPGQRLAAGSSVLATLIHG